MSTALTNDEPRPISFERLLELLAPEHLDRVELQIRSIREQFTCPLAVDYDEVTNVFGDFQMHYNIKFYNLAPDHYKRRPRPDDWVQDPRHFHGGLIEQDWARHLGAQSLIDTRWNAYKGREGGMPHAIDIYTDLLVERHIDGYIEHVLDLHVAFNWDSRQRFAEALMKRFGHVLFPDEDLQPSFRLADHLPEIVIRFAKTMRAIDKQWREQ